VLSTPPVRKRLAQEEEAEAQVVDLDVIGTESMSPLKELDALKSIQAFVDSGLVKLTPR